MTGPKAWRSSIYPFSPAERAAFYRGGRSGIV
jgi:hypothetical protein